MTDKIIFTKGSFDDINHSAYVKNHKVEVNMHGGPDRSYHVNFTVDGASFKKDYGPNQKSSTDGAEVFSHVAKVIHHFVKTHKPRQINMYPVSSAFEPLYQKFGQSIAKKTGGKYSKESVSVGHKFQHVIRYEKPSLLKTFKQFITGKKHD